MTSDSELLQADASARERALDVARSFIVQAPAGSGKTELLIQRYLRLLATVDNPEEILAITFTRKAAAEMRLRVVDALVRASRGEQPEASHLRLTAAAARAVLERDAQQNWGLIEHSSRMRIQTIDALNASLARMRPLTQTNAAGTRSIVTDTELDALCDDAAAATLDWIGDDSEEGRAIEDVLDHVDLSTGTYIRYLSRMLKTRDQWLPFVRSGVASEQDAAGLRQTLEHSLRRGVAARLSALAATLPDRVRDTLAALLPHAIESLKKQGASEAPILALERSSTISKVPDAGDVRLLRDQLAVWRGLAELLLTGEGNFRKTVNKNQGFPPSAPELKAEMIGLLERLAPDVAFARALHEARELPPPEYDDEQWSVLLALFRALPVAVGELKRLCLARGVTDHIEIALTAADALGTAETPGDVALLLDYQIRHILVDEMQDTSKAQYRMLEALCGGWEPGDGRTLFCVGDPMQSIYRFRNAEVSQFLLARDRGIGAVPLEPLVLRRNFRSGERLVDWFNAVFPTVLPPRDDPSSGAVSYAGAVAAEAQSGRGELRVHPLFGAGVGAEADVGCDVVRDTLTQNPGDTVAVLVRTRTQIPSLLKRLRAAGIDYQAVDIDRLSDLPEVIDALALTRALVHDADRVAWLALLRSPWAGVEWRDLHRLVADARDVPVPVLLADDKRTAALSPRARRAIDDLLARLAPFRQVDRSITLAERVERAWCALGGPAILPDRNAVANVYHFFDAIARIERGGTIPDVAALAAQLDAERVSAAVSAPLQIMTMHKAKGLEFDHVVLYGLGRHTGSTRKAVLSWFDLPDEHGNEDKVISPVGREDELENDPIHRFIELTERAKDAHEVGRLLYVACTRARKSLHLVGHTLVSPDGEQYRVPHAGSLLRLLWPAVEGRYRDAFSTSTVHAGGEDDEAFVAPPLRRFERPWRPPDFTPLPGGTVSAEAVRDAEPIHYDWVGPEARLAGTVVHRWLQRAVEGRVRLDRETIDGHRDTSRTWLRQLGASESHCDSICDRVESALNGVLDDARGRWLLEGEGTAEQPLAGIVGGRVETIVIDRVRIDDDGTHWIVDYKTSTHEGGDLDGFLAAECDRYRDQLRRYDTIYRAYSGAETRCALYFPLLGRFVEVDV